VEGSDGYGELSIVDRWKVGYFSFELGHESNISSLHKTVHAARCLKESRIWKDPSVIVCEKSAC
jgi:hypothetical protein